MEVGGFDSPKSVHPAGICPPPPLESKLLGDAPGNKYNTAGLRAVIEDAGWVLCCPISSVRGAVPGLGFSYLLLYWSGINASSVGETFKRAQWGKGIRHIYPVFEDTEKNGRVAKMVGT